MSSGTTAKVAVLVWIPSAVIDRALKNDTQEQEDDTEDMHRAIPGGAMIFNLIHKRPPKI